MTAINSSYYTHWEISHVSLDGSVRVQKSFTSFNKAIDEYQKILRGKSHKNVELFPKTYYEQCKPRTAPIHST